MVKQGYKQTEIGVIPEDWDVKNLIDLSDGGMQNGVFYEVSRKGSGVFFLNVGNLYETAPITTRALEKFDATTNEIERFKVKHGDLFFTRSSIVPSGIAYCNWYKGEKDETTVFDSHVVRFKTDTEQVVPMYLYLQCISHSSRKYFTSNAKVATMTTIDQNQIGRCQIPVPTYDEQERIAEALSDVDSMISSLEKLIAKKKAVKQGAMQELLTGKKRLPGFAGEWKIYKLDELLQYEQPTKYIVHSDKYTEQGIPVLTAGKSLILGYTTENDGIYENLPVIIFDDFVTSSKYITYRFKVKSSAMKMLTLKNEEMNLKLIFELMQMIDFVPVDHQRHWISQYSQFEIKLPPTIEEQTAIASILSDMDNEIEALEQKLEKARHIKQGMMQQLLTGKIRLI